MDQHPGGAVERKGKKACMSVGFLTAEASLHSDSATMQAQRPQAARMLKFGVEGCTGVAITNKHVRNEYWMFSSGVASLKWLRKLNISLLAGLGRNIMMAWLLVRLGIYFLMANLLGIGAGVASNYALSATWAWGRL